MLWSGLVGIVGLGRARSNWLTLLRCPCHELAKLNKKKIKKITPEAHRCIDELNLWYKKDVELKDAVEQVGEQL